MVSRALVALAGLGMAMGNTAADVTPVDCNSQQHLLEVGTTGTGADLQIYMNSRDISPAKTTSLYSVPANNLIPLNEVKSLDACDISPKDDKMYCMVKRAGTATDKFSFDLARVDPTDGHLAYVAAGERDVDCPGDCGLFGGAFDADGNFIASTTGIQGVPPGNAALYYILSPDVFDSFAEPTDLVSMSKASAVRHGRDIAVTGGHIYSMLGNGAGNAVQVFFSEISDALSAVHNQAGQIMTQSADSDVLPNDETKYRLVTAMQGDLYVQYQDGGIFKITLDQDNLKYTAKRLTTAMSNALDWASCKYVPCVCPSNGNVNANSWCPATNPSKCHSCDDGHHVTEGGVCVPDECSCPNGVLADSCPSHAAIACKSCDTGYHLKNAECLPNQCTCTNGVGQTGNLCSSHGSEECARCKLGYKLVGDICVKKHKPLPTCFCDNGTPDLMCTDPTQEACVSCDAGFQLDGTTCVVGELGSMPPNPATAPAAVGSALGGLGLGFGPSPPPRLFEEHSSAAAAPAVIAQSTGAVLAVMGSVLALAATAVMVLRRGRGDTGSETHEQLMERGNRDSAFD